MHAYIHNYLNIQIRKQIRNGTNCLIKKKLSENDFQRKPTTKTKEDEGTTTEITAKIKKK